MNLSDLPARELARLDAICLEYESGLRDAQQPRSASDSSQANEIETLVRRYGGDHADLLRAELEAIRVEVNNEVASSDQAHQPPASASPVVNASPSNAVDGQSVPVPASVDGAPTEAMMADAHESNANAVPKSTPYPVASDALTKDGLPALGTEIGPYLITSVLGRGGMGIVYRATDTRLDRSVAIKILSVGGQQSDALITRFQREAKAVAGLSHPNIVELFDVGVFEGLPYAVMEHLRGETLYQNLRNRREDQRVDPPTVRRWGLQLAQALAAAHQSGVVHRDLKPENVMVMSQASTSQRATEGETILKLFDFGLSRIGRSQEIKQLTQFDALGSPSKPRSLTELIEAENRNKSIASELQSGSGSEDNASPELDDTATRAGMILGTPGYMAPEQARGDMITPATDVFALGCVLYEAMFGRPAFEGDTVTQRFAAVLERQPLPDPIRRRDDSGLTDIILEMLAKDPAKRPTAARVVDVFMATNERESTSGLRHRTPQNSSVEAGEFVVSRRRMIEFGVGGIIGGVLGATVLPTGASGELAKIRSIGVLSFQEAGAARSNASDASSESRTPKPAGDQPFNDGELLSGLLVNELARIDGFTVPKFVPMTARLPSEFQEAAKLLQVDALVTGTFTLNSSSSASGNSGAAQIMNVNLEIISGETGKLIEGITVPTAAGGNLVEQSVLAHDLAELISRELSKNEGFVDLKDPEAFTCLVKGRVRSDPDSVKGLEMAMRCFEHAIELDYNFAQAHAGLGLTTITLAARQPSSEVGQLIAKSQDATARALALAPDNVDARLARAMLDYQVLNDLETADESLSVLSRQFANHWQVQHQAGWLKMILFKEAEGLQLLKRSTGLHPASRFLKADLARANWFRGYPNRAMQAALGLLEQGGDEEGKAFAQGLLIDLYEQKEDYPSAARTDPGLAWEPGDDPSKYYAAREARLAKIPYGPFGKEINSAILQIRRNDLTTSEPAEQLLARLISSQLPMLPLVLCKHPAMASMTFLEQATESFPILRLG